MGQTSAIIDDFNKGEVSPLSMAKLSSSEVKDGVAYCENLIPDPRGPLIPRQGFKHVDEIDCESKYISIYTFEMYEGKSICLVLHDNKLSIYNASTGQYMQQVDSPYTADLLHGVDRTDHNVSVYTSTDAKSLYFLHKSVIPWKLAIEDLETIQENLIDATFTETPFTDIPEQWTGDNYPTCLTFFQDRSWWAGCVLNPETIWASKSQDHEVMTLGSGDNDGLMFVLQHHGLVKWLTGHQDLLIGTSFGEYIATSEEGVITPSDINIDIQSAYGSKSIQPEFIGDEVLYVSPDGRKLRSMWYKWLEAGWKSIDLTFHGNHMTTGTIKDISYVRDPYSTIYFLTGTNQILSCSYLRSNDYSTIGFARITPATNMTKVVAMATIQDRGTSSLWIGAQTEVNGVTQVHLMKQDTKDIYEEQLVMLDNYSEFSPSGTYIDGLEYLEGQEVDIIGDDAILPSQVVVDGSVTLDYQYDVVQVGHAYTQKMITLPYIIYGQSQMGHQMKHWNKIFVSLLNSFPPLINGKRPPTRNVKTPMGDGEPSQTGLTNVTDIGWDREGKITIEQDIPRALMILGIYGELSLEEV
jgi:hypothetical protein